MLLRMIGTMLVTGLACGASSDPVATCDRAATPKVEFGVKGTPCLQAVVVSPDAELKDFRLAERRWLSQHYPGHSVPRWETVLLLPSEPPGAPTKSDGFLDSETAYVQAGDGSEIAVCFYVGLKTAKGPAQE